MIYKHSDLLEKYKNRYQIAKALKNKEIYKIDNGLYSNEPNPSEIEILTKKYPNAVFTMDTAFYVHDLTDVIPRKYQLAINRKTRKIDHPKVETYFNHENFFDIGKTQITINGGIIINVYDKERMLIELVRNKKKIPYDYYKEIINNYREIADTLEVRKVQKYLKHFKFSDSIFKTIRNEVY